MVKGFLCLKTGEKMDFLDCLECARSRLNRKLDCPLDEAIISGMILAERPREGISVTMISGCHRGTFISRYFDYYLSPKELYWAFRGQLVHQLLEKSELHKDAVKEKRFYKNWEGMEISGAPDLIVPSQKLLKDYKTTKSPPSYLNKDGKILAYEGHRVQVNLYRWLVPYEIEELEVVYMTMEETIICPVEPWHETGKKKSPSTVDRYLEDNLIPLKMALESETMPPYERNWACESYCGVREICFRELKKELMASRKLIKFKKGEKENGKDTTLETGRIERAA
jgi:CRISPR/Cas system-associated exonuclease Cas4 (RecB family)